MKTFYYVIEKQLLSYDNVQETSGWKDIRIYRLEDNEMILVMELEIENSENSKEVVEDELGDNGYIAVGDEVKLIQL